MSKRHDDKRHDDNQPERPPKPMRQKAHRTTRHHVNEALHTADDLDAVALEIPVAEHGTHQPPKPKRRRHWKLKSWKRRTSQRRERNAELERLTRRADADD